MPGDPIGYIAFPFLLSPHLSFAPRSIRRQSGLVCKIHLSMCAISMLCSVLAIPPGLPTLVVSKYLPKK